MSSDGGQTWQDAVDHNSPAIGTLGAEWLHMPSVYQLYPFDGQMYAGTLGGEWRDGADRFAVVSTYCFNGEQFEGLPQLSSDVFPNRPERVSAQLA